MRQVKPSTIIHTNTAWNCFNSIQNEKSGGAQTVAMELRKHEFLQIRTQILSRTLAPGNSLEAFLSPAQRQMIV
jgi:hypothetical protein